ncbi:MAG: 4Fe-4S binding protein [Desulfohalobiaceae bacterium]
MCPQRSGSAKWPGSRTSWIWPGRSGRLQAALAWSWGSGCRPCWPGLQGKSRRSCRGCGSCSRICPTGPLQCSWTRLTAGPGLIWAASIWSRCC